MPDLLLFSALLGRLFDGLTTLLDVLADAVDSIAGRQQQRENDGNESEFIHINLLKTAHEHRQNTR